MLIDSTCKRPGSWLGRIAVALVAMIGLLAEAKAQAPQAKAAPVAPQAKAAPKPADDNAVEALSLHYRFTEHYSPVPDPNHPEFITQYRVGARETTKISLDNPGGAPIRGEIVRHTIYTERVARATRAGDLTDAVRRYDRFFYKDFTAKNDASHPSKGAFQGLTLWVGERVKSGPQVINLTADRLIREFEYLTIQSLVSPSRLKGLLPPTPPRIGDTWRIPLPATIVLLPELPEPENYSLEGTLIEVHKTDQPRTHAAILGIQGQFTMPEGPSALNARITFTFKTPEPKPATDGAEAPPTRTNSGVIEARGMITELRLARIITSPIPEGDGRLQQTTNYELLIGREPTAIPLAGDPTATLLALPDPIPKPDEANSWVLYDDPAGRFHLRHPQNLRVIDSASSDVDLEFRDIQDDHVDVFGLQLQPGEGNGDQARLFRDPEYHRRNMFKNWEKQGQDVVKGPIGWLPEADWTPSKRKVYRIEAALRPQGSAANSPRVYSDCYLASLPSNKSIFVTTMTTQDPHVPYRDQVESMIRSFDFGPSRPAPSPAK